MTEHQRLIGRKLEHIQRMRGYLEYSLQQARLLMPIQRWDTLTAGNHETLAAFRVRFSEYQEHIGKLMRAVAIEEEQKTEPYTAVLLYMEKLGVIESAQAWKELRELRNAINHEYEEDAARLSLFFEELVGVTPQLLCWHDRLAFFCRRTYGGESFP